MIILRNKLYTKSEKDNDLDNTSKAYLAGAAGLAGTGGHLIRTSGKKAYKKKLEPLYKKIKPDYKLQKDYKKIEQMVAGEIPMNPRFAQKFQKQIEKNAKTKVQIKKVKGNLSKRRGAGQLAIVGGLGLVSAAGYRYHRNKNKKKDYDYKD